MLASCAPGLITLFASLATARSLWSTVPATYGSTADDQYLLKTAYLVGNGNLGAIPFGAPGSETLVLNLDSLWYGGLFDTPDYTGGNPPAPVSDRLNGIRQWIFQNGTGNVSQLLQEPKGFGSYPTLGNLSIHFTPAEAYDKASYKRTLDLDTGVHSTTWATASGTNFTTSVFCSYPAKSCVYNIASSKDLPELTVSLENQFFAGSASASCGAGFARLAGATHAPAGLKFDAVARVIGKASTACAAGGSLKIPPATGQAAVAIVFSAASEYDPTKGTAASGFSFRGADPGPVVADRTAGAAGRTHAALLDEHVRDYTALVGAFALRLPDTAASAKLETAALVARYAVGTPDPFLEALLFDYSRHLLVCSSRKGSLPANLQGRWTEQQYPAWSSDYHVNINIQMNYWASEQTGLGAAVEPLVDFITNTLVPRGTETARLLYNGEGWVTHEAANIFGYTGMKNDATWTNFPASGAWLMQHVFDHYDYARDDNWLANTGYPLIKGVASFWLSQLQEDAFTKDHSLVVNPCNSPEHGPTTFGCADHQQLVHQVFEAVLAAAPLLPGAGGDAAFAKAVADALARLDRGLHVDATTGALREWKAPDARLHSALPQHRHLSHLIGWFPGYAIAGFAAGGFANRTLQAAVRASLVARGDGTSLDGNGGDYGWPKVWRGACWARLNDSARAYGALQLSLVHNVAPNLLSMYSGGKRPPFQIDMNFGWAGNVLSMLVVDLPLPHAAPKGVVRRVVLGPAIPKAWGKGSVKGLRVRGGVVVDFEWDAEGVVTKNTVVHVGKSEVEFFNVKGTKL